MTTTTLTPDGRRFIWYAPLDLYTVVLVPRSSLSYDEALARIAELEAQVAALSGAVVEGEFDAQEAQR